MAIVSASEFLPISISTAWKHFSPGGSTPLTTSIASIGTNALPWDFTAVTGAAHQIKDTGKSVDVIAENGGAGLNGNNFNDWLTYGSLTLKFVGAATSTGQTSRGEPVHGSDANPNLQPVSVELFAMCSDEIASRIDRAEAMPVPLTLPEWRSGEARKTVAKFGMK